MTPAPWSLDPWALATILAMAVATYACRGGGYWLFRKIRPTPLLRRVMAYLPGTLFVSYVLPSLVTGGLQPVAGTAATVAVMLATRNVVLSILAGIVSAWAVYACL